MSSFDHIAERPGRDLRLLAQARQAVVPPLVDTFAMALGRFDDASILPGEVADHETAAQDIQWNRITELELVPHPANVQHPDTIEAEYGMEGGVLKVRTRAAVSVTPAASS